MDHLSVEAIIQGVFLPLSALKPFCLIFITYHVTANVTESGIMFHFSWLPFIAFGADICPMTVTMTHHFFPSKLL